MKSILLCKKSKEVLSEANGEISPQRTRSCTEDCVRGKRRWTQIITDYLVCVNRYLNIHAVLSVNFRVIRAWK